MTTDELNEALLCTEELLREEIRYLEERIASWELLVARLIEERPRGPQKH